MSSIGFEHFLTNEDVALLVMMRMVELSKAYFAIATKKYCATHYLLFSNCSITFLEKINKGMVMVTLHNLDAHCQRL